jgi:PAS domain S-box-containing protein
LIYNVKSGQCIFANNAAAKDIGGPKEKLLQQKFREIKSWKEGDLWGAAEAAIATGLPQRAEQHVVTSFGKEAYLETVFATFIKGGEQFLLVIVHDILKTKQLEEEMGQKMEELTIVNNTMVGRELKMVELKGQVEELKKKLAEK